MTEQVKTAALAEIKVADMAGFIQQYNDGCLTLHEMARYMASKALEVLQQCQDQGADGLPPTKEN